MFSLWVYIYIYIQIPTPNPPYYQRDLTMDTANTRYASRNTTGTNVAYVIRTTPLLQLFEIAYVYGAC